MRLIDADYVLEGCNGFRNNPSRKFNYGMALVEEIVKNAPTVDAEPIVRCKDCKYWLSTAVESLKDGSYINQPHPCEINCWGSKGEWRTADDFCSRGEKR